MTDAAEKQKSIPFFLEFVFSSIRSCNKSLGPDSLRQEKVLWQQQQLKAINLVDFWGLKIIQKRKEERKKGRVMLVFIIFCHSK